MGVTTRGSDGGLRVPTSAVVGTALCAFAYPASDLRRWFTRSTR
jgi:hypothetical protein